MLQGINLTSLTQNTSSPSYTGSNVLLLGNNNLQFQSFPSGDSNFMLASINLEDSIVNADLAAMNFSLGLVNQLRLENFQGGGHAVFIPAGSGPAGGMLGGVAIWNDGLHLRTIGSDGNTQTLLTPSTGASVELAQFRAIATGAQTFSTGPYPVSTNVVFSTVVEDNLSGFNAGSSSYTIPQSGFYHIGSEVSIHGEYDSSTLSLLINGTGVSLGTFGTPGTGLGENAPTNMVSSTVMELSSGDVLSSEVSINVFSVPATGSFLGQYNGQTYYADLWVSQQATTTTLATGPAGPVGPTGSGSSQVAMAQMRAIATVGQTISAGVLTQMTFDTTVYDMVIGWRAAAAAIGIGFLGLALSLPAQTGETYKARLSAVPADARTRPALAGIGSVTAVLAGASSPSPALSKVCAPRPHGAVACCQRRRRSRARHSRSDDLAGDQRHHHRIGRSDAPADENLHKGGLYVQIHSEKAPDGVLWGWLLR